MERSFAQVGKGAAPFWECRAYKGDEGSIQAYAEIEHSEDREDSTYPEDRGRDREEEELIRITPARSLDMKVAYREACARIDRSEEPEDVEQPSGNLQDVVDTVDTVADGVSRPTEDTQASIPTTATTSTQAEEGEHAEIDPLAAEFSTIPPLLNLAYKVANEQADHRREPRYRPRPQGIRGADHE